MDEDGKVMAPQMKQQKNTDSGPRNSKKNNTGGAKGSKKTGRGGAVLP